MLAVNCGLLLLSEFTPVFEPVLRDSPAHIQRGVSQASSHMLM